MEMRILLGTGLQALHVTLWQRLVYLSMPETLCESAFKSDRLVYLAEDRKLKAAQSSGSDINGCFYLDLQ